MVKASSTPYVSVLVNVRNGEEYLKEALDSVYSQTFQNFEIILYDNCSTDKTAEIAKSYDEKLRYFKAPQPLELGEARNRALAEISGEVFCILDADDYFLPTRLEKQIARLTPEIDLVYANSYILYQSIGIKALQFNQPQEEGEILAGMLKNYHLPIATVMIRTSALPKEPEWWFPPHFTFSEEADLFLRILYGVRAAYIHEPLSVYRIHDANISNTTAHLHAPQEQRELLERLERFIPGCKEKFPEEMKAFEKGIEKYIAEMPEILAKNCWKKGERVHAFCGFLKIFLTSLRVSSLMYAVFSLIVPFNSYELRRVKSTVLQAEGEALLHQGKEKEAQISFRRAFTLAPWRIGSVKSLLRSL